jgi:hypothetical protein
VLEADLLRQCVAEGGSVALVRVVDVTSAYAGTRGAREHITFELVRSLRGAAPARASFWMWGQPGTTPVGQRLLVALRPAHDGAEEVGVLGAAPVPVEGEADVIARIASVLAAV